MCPLPKRDASATLKVYEVSCDVKSHSLTSSPRINPGALRRGSVKYLVVHESVYCLFGNGLENYISGPLTILIG